jgi:hypothetical protein
LGRQNKSPLIKTSSSGSAKHLQQLIGAEFALETGISVTGRGDHHGTNGKIDPRREASGGDDDMKFPGLSKRFDPICPGGVGEAAMVKGNSVLQEPGKVAAEQVLILKTHAQWAVQRKGCSDLSRHFFRIAPSRGKKQKWRQPCLNGRCGYAGPETVHRIWNTREIFDRKLVQGNWTILDLNQLHTTPKSSQPLRNIRGVSHTATQEQ